MGRLLSDSGNINLSYYLQLKKPYALMEVRAQTLAACSGTHTLLETVPSPFSNIRNITIKQPVGG